MDLDKEIVVETSVPVAEWKGRAELLALALYDLVDQQNVDCEVVEGSAVRQNDWLLIPLPAE